MPVVDFEILWPDGSTERCSSPSRAIEDVLAPGASYPVDEFLRRARTGLAAASERVRERYGVACTAAAEQARALERTVARLGPSASGARVTVRAVRRDRGGARTAAVSGGEHRTVAVIGGGQAGLAVSWHLRDRGIDHVVLERERVGHRWRAERWDNFCLVTPNWQCQLPGHPYPGGDRDGFMLKDGIVDYVESYLETFDCPLAEGVGVDAVRAGETSRFVVETTAGELAADHVVLAIGGYHTPGFPRMAERLPAGVTQLHSSTYRNPRSLPDGAVLVVGSGQSGAQIAEDLHLAGRKTHLCVGSAPRVARFHRGRDVVAWLHDMGHYDMPITEHPEGLAARREANHYVTGRGGGRDIDLRAFAAEGMVLHGRLVDIRGAVVRTADDLRANLDAADRVYARINEAIDRYIADGGIEAPPPPPAYGPPWAPDADRPEDLDLDALGVRTVIWATGFRSDWSLVKLPAFDGTGYPTHDRGATSVDGLYVIGLPWLHTWGSARFAGVGRDAGHIAERIEEDTALAAGHASRRREAWG
jgi:putative flavoprotein involved in K+ transport